MMLELPELKAYLKLDIPDHETEMIITAIGEAAEKSVENYLGYSVDHGTYEEEYTLRRYVYLKHAPVIEIVEILNDDGNEVEPERQYLDQGVLRFYETDYQRYYDADTISVEYEAGFEEIPGDLKWAIYITAEQLWTTKGNYNKQSESIGSYSYTLQASHNGLTTQAQDLLAPYRRVRA